MKLKITKQDYPKIKGYYVHYKHDPSRSTYDHMYEVVGIGRNTETKTYTALYRPLYKNDWFLPANFQSRPIDMFLGNVKKDGKVIPRFTRITNKKLIAKLKILQKKMYK